MLNQMQDDINGGYEDLDGGLRSPGSQFSGLDILFALKRQIWVIMTAVIIGAALGVAYLVQAIPIFSSSVSILIDAKNVGMAAATPLEGSLVFDSGAIDSQLEILKSDKLALSVAKSLGLQQNMEFLDPTPSVIGKFVRKIKRTIIKYFGGTPDPDVRSLAEDDRLDLAVFNLQNNLDVERVGRTYVFDLTYSDQDQLLAKAITGQYANAYLEDQLNSKFEATRRAANWMDERIRDLKAKSLAADDAVQKYRADNNLVEVSGQLLDDQSLTNATTQLAQAQAALDTASARYQRLKNIVDTKDVNGGLTQSLDNPNVAQLRSKYLEASKLEHEISAKYGENHQAAQKARKDMEEYRSLIFDELKNLLPGFQSDVAIAQTQLNSAQNMLDQLKKTNAGSDNAMVKLRSLQQESDTLKTLYSTFLQKAQELDQQQSFPVTDARVITEASTTFIPTSPKKALVLALAIFLGGAIGAMIGFVREWRDRGFRTPTQVRDELHLEFIANVPALKKAQISKARSRPWSDDGRRLTQSNNSMLQMAIEQPFSQFAEAFRTMKFKLSNELPKKKGIVLGMASLFPEEGKSTIAKNFASSLALQGMKTLLIDGDIRNPQLTMSLVGLAKAGLIDVVQGTHTIEDASYEEDGSGLTFLPSGKTQQRNDLFSSEKTHNLLDSLRQKYDVVVIDFPPVGALADALSAHPVIDGYFLVVHWGKTPRGIVKEFIINHPAIANKTLGVVLNKVEVHKLNRYGNYLSPQNYGKYAQRYFPTAERLKK